MKLVSVILLLAAILSGCKTTSERIVAACPNLLNYVPGEELIPEPVNAHQRAQRSATICAVRACNFSEIADFSYTAKSWPKISAWMEHNESGGCVSPKYYEYFHPASAPKRDVRGEDDSDLAAVCPKSKSGVHGERKATKRRQLNARIARAAGICAARTCGIEVIERYTYRGQLNPVINFRPSTNPAKFCMSERYAEFRKKAASLLN